MKVKDSLAAQYWIDNTQRIYQENWHVSSPVMEAYVAGFEKARELIVDSLLSTQSPISKHRDAFLLQGALKLIASDIKTLGEENET